MKKNINKSRRNYKNIHKEIVIPIYRFDIDVNYSIIVLRGKLSEMIKAYETMKDPKTGKDEEMRIAKLTVYLKIEQVSHSIKILEKYQS
ncbi:MAG: hypothetical protein V4538_16165 [Bacteroidota bacterium]